MVQDFCLWVLAGLLFNVGIPRAPAQQTTIPHSLHYQGRVSVNGTAFTGSGSFKFALVKQTTPPPAATYESLWSNDGTSVNGSEPTAAVEGIAIHGGQYSLALGDTSLSGMSLALPATVLASHAGLKLRVWFNDGTNGFQQLSPDVGLGAVPYAQVAARVPDQAITGAMVAPRTLSGNCLQSGTITGVEIGGGAIAAQHIQSGSIYPSMLQNNAALQSVPNGSGVVILSTSPFSSALMGAGFQLMSGSLNVGGTTLYAYRKL